LYWILKKEIMETKINNLGFPASKLFRQKPMPFYFVLITAGGVHGSFKTASSGQ